MDRDFIDRNQIVERYLSGRLPARGAADFERFCHANPDLLDELGLPARVNSGLKLLEAAGKPEPWHEPEPKFWQRPGPLIGVGTLALLLLVATAVLGSKLSHRNAQIAVLERRVADQPLDAMTATRTERLMPSRTGPTNAAALTLGGGKAELADLKFDLSWDRHAQYNVTIDREGQGRVALVRGLARDSNGDLRIAFNSSAFGPGLYRFTIEGLDWSGRPEPTAWVSIALLH